MRNILACYGVTIQRRYHRFGKMSIGIFNNFVCDDPRWSRRSIEVNVPFNYRKVPDTANIIRPTASAPIKNESLKIDHGVWKTAWIVELFV